MTKEQMKAQYDDLEREISHMTEVSVKLRAFIGSKEFKELSDLEATLAVTQHHQLEAYARVLTIRAALFGGRLADPDGEKPACNDETPNPIIVPDPPQVSVNGRSVKVGNTIVTEG
jgi:hypothetical protein